MGSNISRRSLLAGGLVLAASASSAALIPAQVAGARLAPADRAGTALRRSTFVPMTGSTFQITDGTRTFPAVLTEVDDLGAATAGAEGQFSLRFTARRSGPRSSDTHAARHPALGGLRLFVSPVDRGAKAHRYEAIINRPS